MSKASYIYLVCKGGREYVKGKLHRLFTSKWKIY
ncbi:hypothetical protein KKC_10826 [Listeria fleischmannii subsp. coloradonensis]|nr:hypothetical protein KKC_10826 [Listeria fleischmannii subsp. coloradonensis]